MGAAARQITAKSSLAFLRDVFRERCEARAILVDAYLLDLQEAVDGLQQAARNYDLIAAFGADHVQAVMAAAFGFRQTQNKPWDEPAPRKFTPKEKAYWEKRFAGSFESIMSAPRTDLAASTLYAVEYLIQQNDPKRFRVWLVERTRSERVAVKRHFRQRNQ